MTLHTDLSTEPGETPRGHGIYFTQWSFYKWSTPLGGGGAATTSCGALEGLSGRLRRAEDLRHGLLEALKGVLGMSQTIRFMREVCNDHPTAMV
jgi:hypothetical protein